MSDGIHVLLSESFCGPGLPVLRSLFEAYLSLEYIMAADTEEIYSRRLRSWDYVETIKDIKKYKSYDPKHQQSEDLRNLVTETMSRSGQAPDFSKAILKAENFLKSETIRDIALEHERTRKKSGRRRRECEWYELFDGPRDGRHLAKAVKQEGVYQYLYSEWSRDVHAGNPRRYFSASSSGKLTIRPLRTCEDLMNYARWTCTFLLYCCAFKSVLTRMGQSGISRKPDCPGIG
jgi:hypothetical protein